MKGDLAYILAESYRKQNNPSKAASAYSKAIRYGYNSDDAYVAWGQSLIKIGKIPEAQEAFNKALTISGKNLLARNGLKSCDMILNNSLQTSYTIEKIKSLNSKYGDYGVAFNGGNYDHIYFSSMRLAPKVRAKSTVTGQGFAHIYESKKNPKGEWDKPTKLEEPFSSPFEEGAPFITPDGKEMYFTRCVLDKTKIVEAQVYKSTKSAGLWGIPESMKLGGDTILYAHPALSLDSQTLYFVSDMPGTRGGKDIWKIEKGEGDAWGKPINLGFPVNTAGDEMFPYIREDGTLYFCSDGHPGFGGLDIFKTFINEAGEVDVENIGTPINSSADDFSIAFMGKSERGFFASSRENSKGLDHIYSFFLPNLEFNLSANVVNERTQQPIKNSYLKIIGSDGTQLKLPIPSDGKLKVGLVKDCDYTMLIAAKGFMYRREKFSTTHLTTSKTFEFTVPLLPLDQAFALNDLTFKTGDDKFGQLSPVIISKTVALLNSNNEMTLEIGGHTDFTKEDNIDTELSQKRAQEVVNQLIQSGIDAKRLIVKGYGSTEPISVDENMASTNKFLKKGDIINEKLVSQLRNDKDKNSAYQLLRRVDVKVIQKTN